MKRPFCIAIFSTLLLTSTNASPPLWWQKSATGIIDNEVDVKNYAPANLGQLKFVSKQAMYHLEIGLYLHGGAGEEVRAIVAGLKPLNGVTYPPAELEQIFSENYSPLNLGQLKAIAKVFYDRLTSDEILYDTKQNLVDRGYPSNWGEKYPWSPATPVSENYAPANLGQLKMVFSFDLGSPNGTDTDGDGMSDACEIANGFDPNDGDENNNGIPDGLEDPDGDLVVSMGEELQGRNPNVGVDADVSGQLGLMVFTPLE